MIIFLTFWLFFAADLKLTMNLVNYHTPDATTPEGEGRWMGGEGEGERRGGAVDERRLSRNVQVQTVKV